jgi:hypothetical protein
MALPQESAGSQENAGPSRIDQAAARQNQIAGLQQEVDSLENEANNDDNHAADLDASAPSGPLGAIDRMGAVHMRNQARSARNRADSLRSNLAQLDAEAAAATEPVGEREAASAGDSSSPTPTSTSAASSPETYNPNRHYSGPGAGMVDTLLARSPGWSCPSSTGGESGRR